MEPNQPDRVGIVVDFQARYLADWERAEVGSLESYQRLYPGFEDLIAREFAALQSDEPTRDAQSTTHGLPGLESEPEVRVLSLAAGARLGPWTIIETLGEGGQGVVLLAEDVRVQRRVALKVLSSPGSPAALASFRREAETVASLAHPGIATVLESGVDAELPWIAFQHVPGRTLAAHLAQARRDGAPLDLPGDSQLPADRVLSTVARVARTLDAAHTAGVVHRDLKPRNLMIQPDGSPVLLDFGVAARSDVATSALTDAAIATPAYASPELLRHEPVDHRTDIWSLGVILFESLTLQRPFSAATLDGLVRAIRDGDTPDPRMKARVPKDVAAIVLKALHRQPKHRYTSALDLAQDLERALAREPVSVRCPGPIARISRAAVRHRAVTAVACLLVLSLVGGLLVSRALTDSALDSTREAERQSAETDAVLAKYDQMSDAHVVEDLIAESASLWPRRKRLIPRYDRWLERARGLLTTRSARIAERDALRASAAAPTEDERRFDDGELRRAHPALFFKKEELELQRDRLGAQLQRVEGRRARRRLEDRLEKSEEQLSELESDPRIGERLTFTLASDRETWRARVLSDLLRGMEQLPGLIQSIQSRRDVAGSIAEDSVTRHRSAWERVIARVESEERYRGLRLEPQVGLVPVGPDPRSGLEEFACLETGAPPNRDPESRQLVMTKTSALVLILLPGGVTTIGSQAQDPDAPHHDPVGLSPPVHDVDLAPFFISKYEMTQSQWIRHVGSNPAYFKPGIRMAGRKPTLLHPVESLTWQRCRVVLEQLGLVLPTEAQWEYACRAGTTGPWFTGDDRDSVKGFANLADRSARMFRGQWPLIWMELDDGYLFTAPVDAYPPNPFGLHGTLGNVMEWCADAHSSYQRPARAGDGLRDDRAGRDRVHRGSSYQWGTRRARSAHRQFVDPGFHFRTLGVRPARRLDP